MANRSYLYSTNVVPGTDPEQRTRQVIGISEWNYDIPIVYKLLLTGNPRPCKSSIWEIDNIGLVGDYSLGLERLKEFVARIDLPAAQFLINEALVFLDKEENRREFFLLECAEIFDMTGKPMQEQIWALLDEIKNLDAEIEKSLAGLLPPSVRQPRPKELLSRLLGMKSSRYESRADPAELVSQLGLGNWSNTLYYDPNAIWKYKGA